MQIEVTAVSRQRWEVEAFKSNRMKQCLEWRQAKAVQQNVLEPKWEIQEAKGLGECACRLADLAHHLDFVVPYRHLKELWTET